MSHSSGSEESRNWVKMTTTQDTDLNQVDHGGPVKRPPRPSAPTLGPYLQFITTDLENMQWLGSMLIFRHVSQKQPDVEFTAEVRIVFDWEILYENLFSMRAYRVNLYVELPQGHGDEKIDWRLDWGTHSTHGSFYVAQYHQKWRGAFLTYNGFDANSTKEILSDVAYDSVWNHLLSAHEERRFHILVWGGNQNYNDCAIEDVPFLQNWSRLPWDEKWTWQLDDESRYEVAKYYFYNYAEHWERRPEMKAALGSIPSLMMWDDHDIFEGAGSYPALLHDSPVMVGLFEIAQKMRLLFQHHTTPEKARRHRLFGYQSHNFLARCGPNLAMLGSDGRSERDDKTVQHDVTWDIVFERLENDLHNVRHLIVLFPVPFSSGRCKMAASVMELWSKSNIRWYRCLFKRQSKAHFSAPETSDHLPDQWTHDAHIEERNRVLDRFQTLADKKRVRVTFFSGDACRCGVSRFQSRNKAALTTLDDAKLMYQIISSAIVNRNQPRTSICAAQLFGTRWYPNVDTEEEFVDVFQQGPKKRANLCATELFCNRSWCYFEQRSALYSTLTADIREACFFKTLLWSLVHLLLLFVGFGWLFCSPCKKNGSTLSKSNGTERLTTSNSHGDFDREANCLRVEFCVENVEKKTKQSVFKSYDLFIPDLK